MQGVGFYALFGLGWLLVGVGHFGGTVAGVAGVVGLGVALVLIVTARRAANAAAGAESRSLPASVRRRFAQVNAVQWVLIAAIGAACGAGGRPELIVPLVAVVVGLHFLPLARVFADRRLAVPGCALTALGVAGLLARAAGASPEAAFTLVGIGSALVLWSTAVWSVLGARRAAGLRSSRPAEHDRAGRASDGAGR